MKKKRKGFSSEFAGQRVKRVSVQFYALPLTVLEAYLPCRTQRDLVLGVGVCLLSLFLIFSKEVVWGAA